MPGSNYLLAMLVGYLLTVVIETVYLVALLSRRHPVRVRLFAGVWLTACTYPIVWLVIPGFFADPFESDRVKYLLVAEIFAPAAECLLFWYAFGRSKPPDRRATMRDMLAIVLANLASFGVGELIHAVDGFKWLLGT